MAIWPPKQKIPRYLELWQVRLKFHVTDKLFCSYLRRLYCAWRWRRTVLYYREGVASELGYQVVSSHKTSEVTSVSQMQSQNMHADIVAWTLTDLPLGTTTFDVTFRRLFTAFTPGRFADFDCSLSISTPSNRRKTTEQQRWLWVSVIARRTTTRISAIRPIACLIMTARPCHHVMSEIQTRMVLIQIIVPRPIRSGS